MSLENKISISVDQTSFDKISVAINVIKAEMPYLQNLTVDDRKSLLKMGDKTVSFVNKSQDLYITTELVSSTKLDHLEI